MLAAGVLGAIGDVGDEAAWGVFAGRLEDLHVLVRVELTAVIRVVQRVREEHADEEEAREEDERVELVVVAKVHEKRDDEARLRRRDQQDDDEVQAAEVDVALRDGQDRQADERAEDRGVEG